MQDRNKELALNTIILGIGQLVPKLLGLITLPIITLYLNTEDYGIYDLIVSCSSLITPIVTLQIQQAIFRYLLMAEESKDRKEYISTSVIFIIASSLVGGIIVFIVLSFLKVDIFFALLITLLYLSESIYLLFGQIVRGLRQNLKYTVSVIIYSVVNVLLIVLLVAGLKTALYGVTISLIMAYVISDIYMLCTSDMLPYLKIRSFSIYKLKELLNFSVPIVPSSISLWVVNLSDRLIIIHYIGPAANGIYAVANKIPGLYNTAYNIFSLAWVETAVKASDDGDPSEYYSIMFKGLYNFLIGIMLMMLSATPFIFCLLVKGDYGLAINQVPILYFGVFFNSLLNFYSGIYIALKRTRQVGISSVLGAIINAAINLLLIKHWGLYAASISTAVSFLVIVLYRAYDLQQVIRIKYDFVNISIGMIAFICGAILLHTGNWICIILSFILTIIYNLCVNREFMVKLMRKVLKK